MGYNPMNQIDNLRLARSLNNRLLVEVYKKGELRSKVSNGFATIDQKSALKGLRVLIEGKLNDGTIVRRNSIAYIREEVLHTQAWAQKPLECEFIPQPFLIVDAGFIEFIDPGPAQGGETP